MRIKKVIVAVVVMLATTVLLGFSVMAETGDMTENITSSTNEETIKNETVYAMLGHDGSVSGIYVVNQLIGTYTDYGSYTEIKNLSTSSVPGIDGDKITFPDTSVDGGLFYQGTMDNAPLPMVFDITYRLDGTKMPAEALAGKSGHLAIEMAYSVNTQCDERVRDGLMAQITMTLNTEKARNITAPDATQVLAGSTVQLAYMALPGENGKLAVEADVTDFEMEPISITLIKGMPSISTVEESIDGIEDGFDELYDGAGSMVDGTTELKDGMTSLSDGVGDLSYGLSKLSDAGDDISDGLDAFSDNLSVFADGINDAAAGSGEIKTALSDLAAGGTSVSDGVAAASDGLSGLCASSADLKALAQSLQANPDPSVQALAQGVLDTLSAADTLSAGLAQASQGVGEYTAGIQQMSDEYAAFHAGLEASAAGADGLYGGFVSMEDGFNTFNDGLGSSASGAYRLYKGVRDLPDSVQKLIDGQIDFQDGIAEARDEIATQTESLQNDDEPPVSFASPDKNKPNSVQYIMTTPAVKIEQSTDEKTEQEEPENVFTRLVDLFTGNDKS